MYVIISDNLEGYSDHQHTAVLVCDTEEQAKKAAKLLFDWVMRAHKYYAEHVAYQPLYETVEAPPCGADPNSLYIPGRWTREEEFADAISYFEIPKWAE